MIIALFNRSLLLMVVNAACQKRDIETVLGGSQSSSISVLSMAYDVEPNSLDMVVGGELGVLSMAKGSYEITAISAFIYFIQEATCSVKWTFQIESLNVGVHSVAFDPSLPTRIYGVMANG